MPDLTDLFLTHVALFNKGVRSGAFDEMLEGFGQDAEMRFVGVPVGPYYGKEAIAAAYKTQPPTDELIILEHDSSEGGMVRARYAWQKTAASQAGRIECQFVDGKIQRMVVSFETG